MIDYSLSKNRIVGMVQYKPNNEIYNVGCYGKITVFNETPDKRYFINLEGKNCFKITQEVNTDYKFRICEIEALNDYNNNNLKDKLKIDLINNYKKYNEIKNSVNLSSSVLDQTLSSNEAVSKKMFFKTTALPSWIGLSLTLIL